MTPVTPEQMTVRMLRAGLHGAMEWQRIAQRRHGGPEACRDALAVVRLYAIEARARLMLATDEPGTWRSSW
jgi:hypothetical protein